MVQAAPKYDGKGMLEFWQTAIKQHFRLSSVEKEDELKIAKLCLEGAARDYVYASGHIMSGLGDLFECLQLRYGISQDTALDEFLAVKQRQGERAKDYGDRLI